MSWPASILVAVLSGAIGLLAGGFVASLAVSWYRISSFEGGAGYFVVGIAILSAFAGAIVGLGAARVVATGPAPSFLKALGGAAGVILALAIVVGGAARLLADVPPAIDGESLLLAVEVRWPAADTAGPAAGSGLGFIRLGAGTMGRVIRRQESGPFFLDDARLEEGRWVAPGAAPIFTSRGERIVTVARGDQDLAGFIIPLGGRPTEQDRSWSEWIPHPRPGGAPLKDGFQVRYRVITRSEPVRIDRVGPFEIATASAYFYNVAGTPRLASQSRFTISHAGAPLAGAGEIDAVAVIGGATPALLIRVEGASGDGRCRLLVGRGEALEDREVEGCVVPQNGRILTSDPALFRVAGERVAVPGWLDRETFATPGLYLVDRAVLDTRTLTSAVTGYPDDPHPINGLPPIGLSPDERSYVWFTQLDGDESRPVLGVTDWRSATTTVVPIDRARMRYGRYESIDPAWVGHHFTWVREDGVDRLVERPAFTPLPYRGELEGRSYTVRPGGEPLRAALLGILESELGAERLPDELDGYHQVLRVDGVVVKVTVVGSPGYVYLSVASDADRPALARLAERLDAALATGRHDGAFGTPE